VELQARVSEFARANTWVVAISYDPVSVLADFAQQQGITFPLLSDEGSSTIRRLDLLNEHVAEQQAYYGRGVEARHHGIPYPGLFMLDENGIVVDRRFELSYRVRPAPDILLEQLVPAAEIQSAISAQAEGEGVKLLAWLGTSTYRPYQKLHLHLAFQLSPELHVYGAPTPQGFTPLTIDVAPIDNLIVESVQLPEPTPYRMDGLEEQFQVYAGQFAVTVPFHIDANQGDVELEITAQYQACTESVCFPPASLIVRLPVRALDMVRA
jgi:peroxiredoxin